jgi:hypothetical protein
MADTDRSPARAQLLQTFRHAPPPGASDAQQVQAVFAMVAETLDQPFTFDRAVWAASLLRTLRVALTTSEEWQQWGEATVRLLDILLLDYRHYRADNDA